MWTELSVLQHSRNLVARAEDPPKPIADATLAELLSITPSKDPSRTLLFLWHHFPDHWRVCCQAAYVFTSKLRVFSSGHMLLDSADCCQLQMYNSMLPEHSPSIVRFPMFSMDQTVLHSLEFHVELAPLDEIVEAYDLQQEEELRTSLELWLPPVIANLVALSLSQVTTHIYCRTTPPATFHALLEEDKTKAAALMKHRKKPSFFS